MLISRPCPPTLNAAPDAFGASLPGAFAPARGGAQTPAEGLDAAALAGLAALDPTGASGLLERVLKTFQGAAARQRLQLDVAYRTGDRKTIRLVAHTLKSSSASIGALALSQRCARIEAAIRQGTVENLDADIAALGAALDAALQAIEQLLAQRRG